MGDKPEPLRTIRFLIEQKKYRIRIHAVQHMIKELPKKTSSKCCDRDEFWKHIMKTRVALFWGLVLCDHSNNNAVDIVTAYIPQKPWWETEAKRGRIH